MLVLYYLLTEVNNKMQKYSRGRRGAPAKGIGRVTGARVQIPPSALKILKKVVDKGEKR